MGTDITIKIGGEAGQGIQTVGQLLSRTCRLAGLYVLGINDFESRIRGGHSFFLLRISDRPVQAPDHRVHVLVAMDTRTYELHSGEVVPDGAALVNDESRSGDGIIGVSFDKCARDAGSPITANTVAAGSILSLMGAPFDLLRSVLEKQFAGRASVLEQNIQAAELGYKAVASCSFTHRADWTGTHAESMLVEGSLALALGALAGDCRFASFYPMSPATSIMMHLAGLQDTVPLVVEQAEDEIAAVNMIIGAAYAGVRSVTSTSGGGFCLMAEGLGYAGIAEVPIVIINAQRPGPATGLATRTGQGDLQFVLHAGQDDFPRFVFAPGSPEEAFTVTARAFDLSEKYQVPAVILVDQYFNDSLYILDKRFAVPSDVKRHITGASSIPDPKAYRRYRLTDTGISPMSLPCTGKHLVMTSGNEHAEDGHISEDAAVRTSMVDKRSRKLSGMLSDMQPPEEYMPEAAVKVVGWGSTRGCVREAVDMLRSDGIDAGAVHFCDLWPFPASDALRTLEKSDRLFVVEQNSTGQFAALLRQETGLVASSRLLKYDGRPFYPVEIYTTIKNTAR